MESALLLAGPVGALADVSDESSRQPHLKSWSNKIPVAKWSVVLAAWAIEEAICGNTIAFRVQYQYIAET